VRGAALSRRVSTAPLAAGCAGVGELCVVRVPDEQPATIAIDATIVNVNRM
jgi:hypothetical protein